jgi:hypothetical protein
VRVRIVRPCEVCGHPTKRPNARYCSGAHADVAYRRRRELEALCGQLDAEIYRIGQTTVRILELTNPTRPTSTSGDRIHSRNRRARPSPIGKERS